MFWIYIKVDQSGWACGSTVNGFGTIVQSTGVNGLWDTITEQSIGVAEWRSRRVTELQSCGGTEFKGIGLQSLKSHRGGELRNKGIAGLRSC